MVTDGRALAALALLGLLGAKAASGSRGIARAGRASPTIDFCTHCGRRPAGWDPDRPPKGFKIYRYPDPEDGPAEWRFQGEPVTCQACQAQADAEEQAHFRGSRGITRSGRTTPERFVASTAFDVFLRGKRINTVYQKRRENQTIQEMCEEIQRGLVGHDGYEPGIVVRKRRVRAAPVAGSAARTTSVWRTIAKVPPGFTGSPLPFVKGYVLEQRVDPSGTSRPDPGFGLYHVTTNLPAVLAEGRLLSRHSLRVAGRQGAGLGGGVRDQAPDRVSVAIDLDQAERIHGAIRTMAEAVHGQIDGATAFDRMKGCSDQALEAIDRAMDFLLDNEDEGDDGYRWAKRVEGELVQAGQEARAARPGPELYEALRRYESVIVDTTSEWFGEGWISSDELVCGTTVGFTESAHRFERVRPESVGLLRLAARRGAGVDFVNEECELRFHPDDLLITTVKQ